MLSDAANECRTSACAFNDVPKRGPVCQGSGDLFVWYPSAAATERQDLPISLSKHGRGVLRSHSPESLLEPAFSLQGILNISPAPLQTLTSKVCFVVTSLTI